MDFNSSTSRDFAQLLTHFRKRVDKALSNPLSSLARNMCNKIPIPILQSKSRRILHLILYMTVIIFLFFVYSHAVLKKDPAKTSSGNVNKAKILEELPALKANLNAKDEGPNDMQISENISIAAKKNKIASGAEKKFSPDEIPKFTTILNNEDICSEGKKVTLLIAVASATDHFRPRKAIRKTWGSKTALAPLGVKLVFLLGTPSEPGGKVQKLIEEETKTYEDIVQEDFLDSYLNLTLKTVMGLRWASTYCADLKFLMKTDDDIFVNVPKLLNHLNSLSTTEGNFVTGCIKQKKSFAPVNLPANLPELPPAHPLFVAGAGYVMSGPLVPRLYRASLGRRVIPVEDVYVTGHLARAVGVHPPIHHPSFTCGELLVDDCDAMQMFTGHKITPERQYQIWEKINPQDYSTSPCFDF